jgi:hypothetical protein
MILRPRSPRLYAPLLVLPALAACGGGGGGPSDAELEPEALPAPPWVWNELVASLPNSIRLMPLGDSITVGFGGLAGYRLPLWLKLKAEGVQSLDFVGSSQLHSIPGFGDPDHEGHSGWTLQDLIAFDDGGLSPSWTIEDGLFVQQPTLILLHAGTNDVFEAETWQLGTARLDELLGRIGDQAPAATTLVAELIPTADAAANLCVDWLNRRAAEVVQERWAAGELVKWVPTAPFCPEFVSGDGTPVHPDAVCYDGLAKAWVQGLRDLHLPALQPHSLSPAIVGATAQASSVLDGHLADLAVTGVGLAQGAELGLHEAESSSAIGWRSEPFPVQAHLDGLALPTGEAPWFQIDLPSNHNVRQIELWNGRPYEITPGAWAAPESIRSVRVWTNSGGGTHWIDRGELVLSRSPARKFVPPEIFEVFYPDVLQLRFEVTSAYGFVLAGEPPTELRVGLAEVRLHGLPTQ